MSFLFHVLSSAQWTFAAAFVDPRMNPNCRDVYLQREASAPAATRWRERTLQSKWRRASGHDWRIVRTIEDLRAGTRPPESKDLVDRLASRALVNNTILEYAMIRKAATKSTQAILRELGCLAALDSPDPRTRQSSSPRRVVFTVVRHPFSKLVSAYTEISRHIQGGACSGTRTIPPICRLAFVKMPLEAEPGRFEAFTKSFLDDRLADYADYRRDGMSYHLDSSMSRIAKLGARLDFIVRVETYERDMKAMLGAFGNVERILSRSHRIESALARDVDAARYDAQLQKRLRLAALSHQTQAVIYEYYKQDFLCLNYSRGDIGGPQWHRNSQLPPEVSGSPQSIKGTRGEQGRTKSSACYA